MYSFRQVFFLGNHVVKCSILTHSPSYRIFWRFFVLIADLSYFIFHPYFKPKFESKQIYEMIDDCALRALVVEIAMKMADTHFASLLQVLPF